MKKTNKYTLHIMNKLAGNISSGDEKELTAWLEANPKNQEVYELIAKIVREGQRMEFPEDPDVKDEWNAFEFPEEPLPKQSVYSRRRLAPGGRIASLLQPRRLVYAALVIFIISISVFWYHQSVQSVETISTENGQQKEITLSDGTTVYLNCGTELLYPRKFTGAIRQVTLSGEAFFDVVKSKSLFTVQTPEGTVTVPGTRFNIRARDMQTRVIVEDGKVRLTAGNSDSSVVLTKDFMSEIFHNQPPSKPRAVNAEELLGWRSGKLVFKRTALSELAGEIGRYYDVNISIENPELEKKTMTAVFDGLPLKNVLYSICATLDIEYKYENGMYIFYKK